MKTLYQRLIDAGIETDNHQSDLYFLWSTESAAILGEDIGQYVGLDFTLFRSPTDRRVWCETPNAFDPFWETHIRNTTPQMGPQHVN